MQLCSFFTEQKEQKGAKDLFASDNTQSEETQKKYEGVFSKESVVETKILETSDELF